MNTVEQLNDFNSEIVSSDITLAVKMGRLPGYSTVDKFGVLPEVTSAAAAPFDIWEFGDTVNEYPFDTDGTAPIVSISSSNDTDTQAVSVQGLDVNGDLVTLEPKLQGQTVTTLDTPLWRVFRMQNEGSTNLAGTVYCYTGTSATAGVPPDANVRAIIDNGNNQTLMSVYTVPKGYVGFLFRGEVGVGLKGNAASLAEYAHCHYESRRYGKVFKIKKAITCMVGGGSSVYQDERSFPDIIPSLTDIRLRGQSMSSEMGLFGTFDIMLVEENLFSESYLTAIGQPGY